MYNPDTDYQPLKERGVRYDIHKLRKKNDGTRFIYIGRDKLMPEEEVAIQEFLGCPPWHWSTAVASRENENLHVSY